jgi:hypothetical protein
MRSVAIGVETVKEVEMVLCPLYITVLADCYERLQQQSGALLIYERALAVSCFAAVSAGRVTLMSCRLCRAVTQVIIGS